MNILIITDTHGNQTAFKPGLNALKYMIQYDILDEFIDEIYEHYCTGYDVSLLGRLIKDKMLNKDHLDMLGENDLQLLFNTVDSFRNSSSFKMLYINE